MIPTSATFQHPSPCRGQLLLNAVNTEERRYRSRSFGWVAQQHRGVACVHAVIRRHPFRHPSDPFSGLQDLGMCVLLVGMHAASDVCHRDPRKRLCLPGGGRWMPFWRGLEGQRAVQAAADAGGKWGVAALRCDRRDLSVSPPLIHLSGSGSSSSKVAHSHQPPIPAPLRGRQTSCFLSLSRFGAQLGADTVWSNHLWVTHAAYLGSAQLCGDIDDALLTGILSTVL